MAPRELSFIHSRAPRAAGLSDNAVDEHKDLIGDLYLTQNYTRDQVINYLETNLSFTISRDQFSKATRRWGFHKQPRGALSIQSTPNETASQSTPCETASNEPSCVTTVVDSTDQGLILTNESSKRPRSGTSSISRRSDITTPGPSSPLPRRPLKRPKPRSESGDYTPGHVAYCVSKAAVISLSRTAVKENTYIRVNCVSPGSVSTAESLFDTPLDLSTDGDFLSTPLTAQSSPRCQYTYDDKLSAEYLSCCHRYTKAFNYYLKISIPFQHKTPSAKQRRARMLDMARTAKKRRLCEIVKVMMESELKMSNDPLIGEERDPCPSDGVEMSPMQSFLFHRHLAQIYAHNGDTSLEQKHLDKARNFTKAFDALGPESIDLWTLLHLQGKKHHDISEDLLNSLQWDNKLFASDMERCLTLCWRTLRDTQCPIPFPGYDKERLEGMNPTKMSDLALQKRPLYLWRKSSFLFTHFWKHIQLERESPVPWGQSLPTISATHFLMVMSRIIVQRSLLVSSEPSNGPPGLQPSDVSLYCEIIPALLYDNSFTPESAKREFATQFVEHYSWSPPSARKSDLAREVQTHQMEALESVLATRRSRSSTPTPPTLTALKEIAGKIRRASTDNEFLDWLVEQHEQLASTNHRDTIVHVEGALYPPSFGSSSISSYLRTSLSAHHIYLDVLNGNPTLARSLASRSSRSSQVSGSSSLQRFKAAAPNRKEQPDKPLGPGIHELLRRLEDGELSWEDCPWDDYFQSLERPEPRRDLKSAMPTLMEEGSVVPEEEKEKSTTRWRIGKLLKGKGKVDAVGLE
ncbi:hypothetical protein FNAPI_1113 [Fusarium napiforme]|uniref:Clr5 domain-containing protein n=1 Tax=Fusarium napiforme TaxID=42672 RepID=A0A8H5K2D5_9HYPO|nr:hypothetical protein FNAPI_1113 [Fusarium napiforme]